MKFSHIAAIAISVVLPAALWAGEGSIKGNVKYNGDPPAPKVITVAAEKQGDCKHDKIESEELVVDKETKGIKWAMVRVIGVKAAPAPAPAAEPSVEQKGCHFTPHVVIVAPTSNLTILNGDKVAHNFHTTPLDATNPGFNRMMTAADEKLVMKGEKYFGEPEVIKMQCDVHPWMNGFIVCHDPPSQRSRTTRATSRSKAFRPENTTW